ncbi:MAG: TMEM14 family protein [Candidatus Omnitrophica bacterium]|nr:TMEM14 family protein [Candidatus Omnitrophota bacterium]
MMHAALVVGAYGVFTVIGGVIGYVKAKSRASLVAGCVFGAALIAGAYGVAQDSVPAAVASMAVALMLGMRFVRVWQRQHRVMPDLLMVLLSLATLVTVGLHLTRR